MRNYYGSLCTKLYHASPTAGLTVLRPSVTEFFGKPRQVCLTSLKPMALLYLSLLPILPLRRSDAVRVGVLSVRCV